jgi:hypothetical protein
MECQLAPEERVIQRLDLQASNFHRCCDEIRERVLVIIPSLQGVSLGKKW